MPKTFQKVAIELEQRIRTGTYPAGAPLPSERTLEEEFDVHRTTVRRAIESLAQGGLLTRRAGHRPLVARGASATKTAIGLFAGARVDPYARAIVLQGMQEVLRPNLTVFAESATSLFPQPDFPDPAVPLDPGLAGMILLPPHQVDLAKLRDIREQMPVVIFDRMVPGFESDFVGFQDFEAGYAAARHLYDLGHRKIAFLGSVIPATADHRSMGVDAFCRDAGIERTWNFCAFSAGRTVPEEYIAAFFELARETWPTAAVCTNDETAAYMIATLGRLGLRVPHDLALVGFGNAQTAMLAALGLSTMAQPYHEVGREALQMVLQRLDGTYSGCPVEVRLPLRLVIRSSCGSGLSQAT